MFEIDNRSRVPIYEQICGKIKELVALGILQKGEQLPAVRALARDTGINPNTIQKAFAKLEQEQIIFTVMGKGSFVNVGEEEKTMLKEKALNEIKDIIVKNKIYNITATDINNMVMEIFKEESDSND